MKRIVNWAITNSPGMNVLVSALMLVGAVALYRMRREVFPTFELEIVTISVPYPGATPQDCEEAICQKIEEAIRSLDGIKNCTRTNIPRTNGVVDRVVASVSVEPKNRDGSSTITRTGTVRVFGSKPIPS